MKHLTIRNTSAEYIGLSDAEILNAFLNLPRHKKLRQSWPHNERNNASTIAAIRWMVSENIYCCTYRYNLARLSHFANNDEILNCVKAYHSWFVSGKPKRNFYDKQVMSFGKMMATKLTDEQSVRSSKTGKAHYHKNIHRNDVVEKSQNTRRELNKHELYRRKKNPLCIEFYTTAGIPHTEALVMLAEAKEKCCLTLSWFISEYGVDEGTREYSEMIARRGKAISDSMSTGRAGYSASSQIVFDVVLKYLTDKWGISKDLVFYGTNNGEYFIRKPAGGCYYMDFCIPSLNICIEFNGVAWHPKSKETYRPIFGRSYEDALAFDAQKNETISTKYDLLIVWEDDVNYEQIYDWLDLRISKYVH